MSHTPGPWKYHNNYVEVPRGVCLARVAIIDDSAGIDNPHANGRLIAAAPELLDALEAVEWSGQVVETSTKYWGGEKFFPACPLCIRPKTKGHSENCLLSKAIAKAKGES